MLKNLIRIMLINGVALFLTSRYISGFHLNFAWQSLVVVTVVFTAIHLFVKPILGLFFGPINFLTFGSVSLALDVGILYILSVFFPQVSFSSWLFPGLTSFGFVIPAYQFPPLGSTIISALLINFVRGFLTYLAT